MTGQDPRTGNVLSRRALFPLGAIIVAMLSSSCANVLQGDGGAGGSGTDDPDPALYDHATGSDDVLVSIASSGGYVPLEHSLRNVAQFLLLGDGTAVVGGVTIAIYPGPAIAPLQSATLNEGQIQDLLAAADDAGLLAGEIDFGEPGVTDMDTTTVTITANGRTVRQSAYALSFYDEPASGLSEAEIAARAALQGFIDIAQGMVGSASTGYEPAGVIAFRLGAEAGGPVEEPELEQPPQQWPIATVPPAPIDNESDFGACTVIFGAEVPTLLAALAEANELTPWLIGTDPPARIVFRPYLPGDPGCD